ncbi:hypothetical protein CFELI_03125 [Corynebacterium felinum]|uniref:Uncharacterized protein n=1 Tax=Corynebacterium felinum TaxID=131318 RepID=A0ABU2B8F9_9CORY|nr:hypothetical protein [Corynebacterium felinum]WJY94267.1 hypothetical protein CFELI_03125 [Corynebacterium felinum]
MGKGRVGRWSEGKSVGVGKGLLDLLGNAVASREGLRGKVELGGGVVAWVGLLDFSSCVAA